MTISFESIVDAVVVDAPPSKLTDGIIIPGRRSEWVGAGKYQVHPDGRVRKASNRHPVKDRAIIAALVPQPTSLYFRLACCGQTVDVNHAAAAALHWGRCVSSMQGDSGKIPHSTRIDRDPEAGPYIRDTTIRRTRRRNVRCGEPRVLVPLVPNPKGGMSFAIRPWSVAMSILAGFGHVLDTSATRYPKEEPCDAPSLTCTRTSRVRSTAPSAVENGKRNGASATVTPGHCSTVWLTMAAEPRRSLRRRRNMAEPDQWDEPSVDDVLEEARHEEHDDIGLVLDDGKAYGPLCDEPACMWRWTRHGGECY
ncbi:hypothetical protein M1247_21885 [Mycobacterium sp. 21AC1]|uniref:hypothetical protein n=1 Tax=[Mycobacterium] appelbergii TaxID=2939269 RepID=UPI002938D367|nr:hypothetical protein [Mycobacterium sp. 21AC1]MDV3127592.1 hypothetical protein [Mycobacterium sp. 21AC1]